LKKKKINLDFGKYQLQAELFETEIAEKFFRCLPCSIDLIQWGGELYGPIRSNLGEKNPVPEIPPGGIAYTSKGNYVCFFFGQTPAWPVEYVGYVLDSGWKKIADDPVCSKVNIEIVQQ